jgi:hypothetical protein
MVQDRTAAPWSSWPAIFPAGRVDEMGPQPINAKTRGSDFVIASWSRVCEAPKSLQARARSDLLVRPGAAAS